MPPTAARPPGAAASGAAAPGAIAAAPAPGQPPPFATVIQGAREIKGLFIAWQKDERLWLELRPEDFDQPSSCRPSCAPA